MDTQSAHVHACKVRRSDSHCSNLGSTTAEDRCQDLRSFAERPLLYPGSQSLENRPTKTRSTTLMTLLESSMLTLSTSSMRHVAILQQVQNPPRCQRVFDKGSALEDWLSEASNDSLVAAMFRLMPKSLEESVMFTNEDEGFQELFDRLLV